MNIACYIHCDVTFQQVQDALVRSAFECRRFFSEAALLRTLRRETFSLILFDTGSERFGDKNVFSWLKCRSGESTPVVLLCPSCCSRTVASALDAGADECIGRPFDAALLMARLNAVLRRYSRRSTRREIELGGFTLDRASGRFLDRGTPIELTPREFTMAWLFFSSPGVNLSRETIGAEIWGAGSEIASRTIEQHVYKLRKKLNLCDERGVRIRTGYTKGYRLELCGAEGLSTFPSAADGDAMKQGLGQVEVAALFMM